MYQNDGEQERRYLDDAPRRYMPFPGCRRCEGYGLRECDQWGHDQPPTVESLEQRIIELEDARAPRPYVARVKEPAPPASASVKSVMDE